MPELIELAQNRKIAIKQGARHYTVTISPISEATWFKCFDAIIGESKCKRSKWTNGHIDVVSAGIGLVQATAVAAQGYPDLKDVPNWQLKLPEAHLFQFGNVLLETYVPDEDAVRKCSESGTVMVRLNSLWNAGEGGSMVRRRHLVHHFYKPSAEQQGRYRRAGVAFRSHEKTSRGTKTVYLAPRDPLQARVLVALYDELIVRVEGYAVDGRALGDRTSEIVHWMDTFHKVTAARPLFEKGEVSA